MQRLKVGLPRCPLFLSEATAFSYDDGREEYAPRNFNNVYADDYITMLEAVAYSDNIYAVKTHLSIGTSELVSVGENVGLGQFAERPSLALALSLYPSSI